MNEESRTWVSSEGDEMVVNEWEDRGQSIESSSGLMLFANRCALNSLGLHTKLRCM